MELLVYPVIFLVGKEMQMKWAARKAAAEAETLTPETA